MNRRNRKKSTAKSPPRQSSQLPAPSEPIRVPRGAGGTRTSSLSVTKTYSGPIPPPELLERYDQIVPGSAQTIIDQFTKQGDHRMSLEQLVIRADVQRSKWGLIAGFTLAIVTIIGSFYMMYLGKETVGFGGVLVAVGSLVTTFIYGTVSRRKEREEKERLRQEVE